MHTRAPIPPVAVLALAASVPALACCMLPAGFPGQIGQTGQQAILFFKDGREELILRIDYQIAGEQPPDRFAWIITVPSEPDRYNIASEAVLADTLRGAQSSYTPRNAGGGRLAAKEAALEFGKAAKVGPYEIQPVRARGMEALSALNAWLAANGFPTEEAEHMRYFVENKFTFLCIKVTPAAGDATVGTAGGVPPLQMSFATPSPYYPLKFSSRQGVFDVGIVVFTAGELDVQKSADVLGRLNAFGPFLGNLTWNVDDFPTTLRDAYARSAFADVRAKWHMNLIRGPRVNEGSTIATWKDDIFLTVKN